MTIDSEAIRYVADEDGHPEAAIVPIEIWREIRSDYETRRLLENPVMRERLLRSIASTETIPLDEALRQLGTSMEEMLDEDD